MRTWPDRSSRANGHVTHTLPAAVEAGSYQDFTVTYNAGHFGVDDTGGVKICWRRRRPRYAAVRRSRRAALRERAGIRRRRAHRCGSTSVPARRCGDCPIRSRSAARSAPSVG